MRLNQNRTPSSDQVPGEYFRAHFVDADEFDRSHLDALFTGSVAALRIRRFLPLATCSEVMARIGRGALAMDSYDPRRVQPPVARFGPAINDFRDGTRLSENYWVHALRARRRRRTALGPADPARTAVARLGEVAGRPLAPAHNRGRRLFAGTLREINQGALMHCDDVLHEYGPELLDEGPPVIQIAFNAWVSTAPEGGTTCIWRRRRHSGDASARVGYGYDERIAEGEPRIDVRTTRGDALLFDSRYLHSVRPSTGGRRLAVAFFIGLTRGGELIIWS